jgi:hypothetical protein
MNQPKSYYQSIEDRQILMCLVLKHQAKALDEAIKTLNSNKD